VITAPGALALFILVQNGGTDTPLVDLADRQVNLKLAYSRKEPPQQEAVASSESKPEEFMVKRGGRAADDDEGKQPRVRKFPGGWKLPGDPTIYPYNPLLPPDMVDPVPPPPDRRPAGGKASK
jgi:hypothetical protein